MGRFLQRWGEIINNLEHEVITQPALRGIFVRELENSTALAQDVAHYHRQGKNHADRSYRCLRQANGGQDPA